MIIVICYKVQTLAMTINNLDHITNDEGDNLLHIASERDSYRCAVYLLEQDIFDMGTPNSEGLPYLDAVLQNDNNTEMVELLMRHDSEFTMIASSFGWDSQSFEISNAIITALEFNQYNFKRDDAKVFDAAL